MKIAIDLDNTLFNNKIVKDVIDEFGISCTSYHWELDDLGTDAKNECMKRFKDPNYMCTLTPILGNKKKIKEWHKQGHELVCVTSRDCGLALPSIVMLKQHYPEIKSVIFAGSYDKSSIYAKEKFDIVIDDHHEHIKQAIKFRKTQKVYFISNKHTPYNWGHVDKFKKYKRVVTVGGIRDITL